MAKGKKLQSNFSRGELSPRLAGRPDLAAYFNGLTTCENYYILPQGGLYRPPGTRFVAEVKDSTAKTRLIPFVFSRTQAYWLEVGNIYMRFYRNGVVLGGPVEVVTPYLTAELFDLHFAQSADVLFLDHQTYAPRKLSRVSDTSWTFGTLALRSPPSYPRDFDISGGSITLTPAATSGTGVNFTASSGVFLAGDEDRQIIFGASRAIIVSITSVTVVVADIIDNFPNTSAIPAGSWLLRGSPTIAIDATKREPIGGAVSVDSQAVNSLRAADVGRFFLLWGGCIEITKFTNAQLVTGIIRSILSDAIANPAPTAVGAFSLNTASWSAALGYPKSPGFYQGRLGHCNAPALSTSWWLSRTNDYENYAVGALADDALDYLITSRQVNGLVWMVDLGPLILGSNGAIFAARGPGVNQPLGGDVIPDVTAQDAPGALAVQPCVIGKRCIYIDASGLRVIELGPDAQDSTLFYGEDLTRASEHITGTGLATEQIAYADVPNRHLFFVRDDGQLAVLTYFPRPEQVIGWGRRTTDGVFESICVIPHPDGDRDQVACIVKRTINGSTKRYIEVFEDNAVEFVTAGRPWTELHTDCAKVVTILSGATTITGLSHLEAKSVDVLLNGRFIGQKTVTAGVVTLSEAVTADTVCEVGLHFDSTGTTMPAAMQDSIIDDQVKMWDKLSIRFLKSLGCQVNGNDVVFPVGGEIMDTPTLFTGKHSIQNYGWDKEGKVTFKQPQPYPQTILSLGGWLNVGDK